MSGLSLIEFPADDLGRAQRFWEGLLGIELTRRRDDEGQGIQTHSTEPELGVHARGPGPGDRFSLPYFRAADLPAALDRVVELGGDVVHPGERFAVCRDSEGIRSVSPASGFYTRRRAGSSVGRAGDF